MSAVLLILGHPDDGLMPSSITIQSATAARAGDPVLRSDDPAGCATAWQAVTTLVGDLPEPADDPDLLARHFPRRCRHVDGRECGKKCFPGRVHLLDLHTAVVVDAIVYNICGGGYSQRPDDHARRAMDTYEKLQALR